MAKPEKDENWLLTTGIGCFLDLLAVAAIISGGVFLVKELLNNPDPLGVGIPVVVILAGIAAIRYNSDNYHPS